MRKFHDSQHNPDDFHRYCPCAYDIENYVVSLQDGLHWTFNHCALYDIGIERYEADFTTPDSPEYSLTVTAVKAGHNKWTFTHRGGAPKVPKSVD